MAVRILNLRMPIVRVAFPSIAHDPGSASLRRGLRAAVVVPRTGKLECSVWRTPHWGSASLRLSDFSYGRAALRVNSARLWRTCTTRPRASLSFSFRRMLTKADEPIEEISGSHRIARGEAIRAQEVFEQFLIERTRQAPGVDIWAMLLSSGKGFC